MWGTTQTDAVPGFLPGLRYEHQTRRVLVCEDDDRMRAFLAMVLADEGFEVVEAMDGSEALHQLYLGELDPSDFDLVVTDHRMPHLTGVELLRLLRELGGGPPVILLSAFADEQLEEEALRAGAAEVLAKPFGLCQLLGAIQRVDRRDA